MRIFSYIDPKPYSAGKMKWLYISAFFEPRDCWIGVYWKPYDQRYDFGLDIYICLLPMCVLLFEVFWEGNH